MEEKKVNEKKWSENLQVLSPSREISVEYGGMVPLKYRLLSGK
jgi:hypothetical protein